VQFYRFLLSCFFFFSDVLPLPTATEESLIFAFPHAPFPLLPADCVPPAAFSFGLGALLVTRHKEHGVACFLLFVFYPPSSASDYCTQRPPQDCSFRTPFPKLLLARNENAFTITSFFNLLQTHSVTQQTRAPLFGILVDRPPRPSPPALPRRRMQLVALRSSRDGGLSPPPSLRTLSPLSRTVLPFRLPDAFPTSFYFFLSTLSGRTGLVTPPAFLRFACPPNFFFRLTSRASFILP